MIVLNLPREAVPSKIPRRFPGGVVVACSCLILSYSTTHSCVNTGLKPPPSSPGGRGEGGAESHPPLWPPGMLSWMICIMWVCVHACTILLDPHSI